MIVDSSALPEQVVRDALNSAFNSAGQRCSALRVLFLQSEIAEKTIEMIVGAMAELKVGNPRWLATDVGPVIDENARGSLRAHAERMESEARHLATVPLPADTGNGTFFAPRAFEIPSIGLLTHEVFGPILHVVRYAADKLDAVADSINGTGYGLTVSIHSRVDANVERLLGTAARGQCLREPEPDRCGRRRTAVRRRRAVGYRSEGGRAALPASVRRGTCRSIDTTAAGGNAALLAEN